MLKEKPATETDRGAQLWTRKARRKACLLSVVLKSIDETISSRENTSLRIKSLLDTAQMIGDVGKHRDNTVGVAVNERFQHPNHRRASKRRRRARN